MSILIGKNTKIVCQGLTGKQATKHCLEAIKYGTKIVAGVTPGKGGIKHLGLPVFNSVKEAIYNTKATVSVIYVPAKFCKSAILESIKEKIKLIICITEGIPILDMLYIKNVLIKSNTLMIGPNCPGIIVPKICKIGIMPSNIFIPGKIAVISRSGTLSYEIIKQMTEAKIGQSIFIGIGGDPILGLNFVDILKLLKNDKNTIAIIIIGEIGGNLEENAAFYIKNNINKPVICYIAGIKAPKEKRLGHAGAIINNNKGNAIDKINILKKSGVHIINKLCNIKDIIKNIIDINNVDKNYL